MRAPLHRIEIILFYLLFLLLPTQLGKHFWPAFAFVDGIRVDYLAPTVYVTDILIALLFICWIIRWRPARIHFKKMHRSPLLPFFGFCLLLLVSILFSSSVENELFHLVKFLEFSFVAYYIAQTVRTTRQLIILSAGLSFGVIGESLLALVQYLMQSSVGGLMYWFGERSFTGETPGIANASVNGSLVLRPYGTFSHPNVLAGYLLLSLTIILFMSRVSRSKSLKLFLWITLLLGTSGLILTMSRVAIALWFVVFAVVSFSVMRKSVVDRSSIMIGSLCFLLASIGFFFSPVFSRFLQMSWLEESFVAREALMANAFTLLWAHPLTGVGLGNFIPQSAELTQSFSLSTLMQPVHNIFLLLAVEVGLVGLGMGIWFLIKTYRHLLLQLKQSQHLSPILLVLTLLSEVLLLGMVDHYFLTVQQGQLLLGIVCGMAWISFPLQKNKKSS